MKIASIIIPVYNRHEQLERCLNSLIEQKEIMYEDFEIVIHDMSDNFINQEFVSHKKLSSACSITYIHNSKSGFNISNCRNIAANHAEGKYLTFIDVDLIVPNNFIESLLKRLNTISQENICLIHYIYGFNTLFGSEQADKLFQLEPGFEKFNCNSNDYLDIRDVIFSDQENKYSEIWVFGWSGLITYSKKYFVKLNGFDESFEGWGSEDTDLSYRMFKDDVVFIPTKEIYGVHIPHIQNISNKNESNFINRKALHKKFFDVRTELYMLTTGLFYQNYWNMIESITFDGLNPLYTDSFIKSINSMISEEKETLCIGLDSPSAISKLSFNHYLVMNSKMSERIYYSIGDAHIYESLGISTKFSDDYFDIVILFDSIRFFPKSMLALILQECSRISKKVIRVNTKTFDSYVFNSGVKNLLGNNEIDNSINGIEVYENEY
ncbi:glycosyltransferase family 2 protein [Paenibacillus pini]|uniref:Glycosyltransferase n=1 Tax=Paenibacillus pini JCM 16418 TaxID=1236976 RepID=W7Z4E5_9BACL|nr:glycosyltransferase [Paenibacillus pini]GAF09234.1 glycosyltransferase [Paenibacillus pini JCM 16418]